MIEMDIIVLVKQVPDPREYVRLREDGTLDREKTRAVINDSDKNALEAALQLKEKLNSKVVAVSMGPLKAEDALREALAMGVDDAVLISDRRLRGSDTLATSYVLYKAIKKLGSFDLILCGAESSDGGTAQVGPELAEYLGIPQATFVEEFEVDGDYITLKRRVDGGYEKLRLAMPALLTVLKNANKPRATTFSGILRAVNKPIATWSLDDVGAEADKAGLAGSPTRIMKVEKISLKRRRILIEGKGIEEIVNNLLRRLREDGIVLEATEQ
ncbi:MAG: electron transfer flavoprotein subunit beta/FixA family protein [Candidatus Brockarchaeota archaeon]|nr:electron transfer flavoprotein subunit beta/FixA family protein [Candidatus Brockarchaeota archaeon]